MSSDLKDAECPKCGEWGLIFYPGEEPKDSPGGEPDTLECPDCGYMEVLW